MSADDRTRGEHIAPWLVMLSQHMPEVRDMGEVLLVGCSCGATKSLYVGHIAGVIADRHAALVESLGSDAATGTEDKR